MASNTRHFHCAPEAVFAVLGDGWLYPTWVVGAARMRDVDARWPGAGARLLHSFGVWPVLTDDTTRCEVWEPPHRAELIARGWPMGEARVTFDVSATRAGCRVRLTEVGIRGPVAAIPKVVLDPILRWRNTEVLRRLAFIAEGGGGASRNQGRPPRQKGDLTIDPYGLG